MTNLHTIINRLIDFDGITDFEVLEFRDKERRELILEAIKDKRNFDAHELLLDADKQSCLYYFDHYEAGIKLPAQILNDVLDMIFHLGKSILKAVFEEVLQDNEAEMAREIRAERGFFHPRPQSVDHIDFARGL